MSSDRNEYIRIVFFELMQLSRIFDNIRLYNRDLAVNLAKLINEKAEFEFNRLGIDADLMRDSPVVYSVKDGKKEKLFEAFWWHDFQAPIEEMFLHSDMFEKDVIERRSKEIELSNPDEYWKEAIIIEFKAFNKKWVKLSKEDREQLKEYKKTRWKIKNGQKSCSYSLRSSTLSLYKSNKHYYLKIDGDKGGVQSIEKKEDIKDVSSLPVEDTFHIEYNNIRSFSKNTKKYYQDFIKFYNLSDWESLKTICDGYLTDEMINLHKSKVTLGEENCDSLYIKFKENLYRKEATKIMLLQEKIGSLDMIRPEHITTEQKRELIKLVIKKHRIEHKTNVCRVDVGPYGINMYAYDIESKLQIRWKLETVVESKGTLITLGDPRYRE